MYKDQGVTLIELLIVIAILGIFAAFATPSFSQFIADHRNREAGRRLFTSLNYARSIAVFRQRYISLCASSDAESCNQAKNWTFGGIIFQDDNKNGSREAGEELLQLVNPVPAGSSLNINPSLNKNFLGYKPDGGIKYTGNFQYCPPDNDAASGWIIVWFWTGRAYYGRDNDGDGVVETGGTDNLSCPASA